MSVPKSDGLSALASRVFGEQNDTDFEGANAMPKQPKPTELLSRTTYDQPSKPMHTQGRDLENGLPSPAKSERPPIPSALPSSGEAATTPLPILPMIVLSIVSWLKFSS